MFIRLNKKKNILSIFVGVSHIFWLYNLEYVDLVKKKLQITGGGGIDANIIMKHKHFLIRISQHYLQEACPALC